MTENNDGVPQKRSHLKRIRGYNTEKERDG